MRRLAAALVGGGLLLAACSDEPTAPSPPTPDTPQVTATDELGETEPDTSVETSEPVETEQVTEEPTETATETAAPSADPTETPEADGPPQMPDEAMEDSEEGAEAFVLNFIDVWNYVAENPEAAAFDAVGTDSCERCSSLQGAFENLEAARERTDGPGVEVKKSSSVLIGEMFLIEVDAALLPISYLNTDGDVVEGPIEGKNVTLYFEVYFEQGSFLVDRIVQVDS